MGWRKFLVIVAGLGTIIGLEWSLMQIMEKILGNCVLLQLTKADWIMKIAIGKEKVV